MLGIEVMMRYSLARLFCVSIAGGLFMGCSGFKLKEIQYSVNPNPLHYQNDSVRVTIKAIYPAKLIPARGEAVVTPYLEYEGGTVELKPLALRGAKAPTKVGITLKPQGGEITYEDVVPYKTFLDRARLKVKARGTLKGKVRAEIALPDVLAYGTVITPLMAENMPVFMWAPDKLGPVNKVHSTLVYFPFNSSEIRPIEKESPEVEGFRGFAERYAKEGATFKYMEVIGYASPEGPDPANLRLSENRAANLEALVLDELRKIKQLNAVSSVAQPKRRGVGRDVQGFNKKLEEKKIPEKDKIRSLVEQGLNRIALREKVQNLSPVLDNELEVELLAPLRRAEVLTTVEVQPRSDAEILKLSDFNPSGLTLEEGLYAAGRLVQDNEKRLKILEALQEKFPEDWRPYNNAGVVAAAMGKTEAAGDFFRKAEKLAPQEKIVRTNLGIWFSVNGDTRRGREYLESAGTAEAGAALVPDLLKKGRYEEAVRILGDDLSFNAALSQLLNGKPEVTLNILEKLKQGDPYKIQYLKTIALARIKNEQAFFEALKKLLEGCSAKEKKYILTEPEFLSFWSHPNYPKS